MLAQEAALKEGLEKPEAIAVAEPMATTKNDLVVDNTAADEIETAILHYLKRVGNASPHDIQSAMDLSKATAFRRLQQMVQSGTVIRTGKTAAIRYRLAARNTDASPEWPSHGRVKL